MWWGAVLQGVQHHMQANQIVCSVNHRFDDEAHVVACGATTLVVHHPRGRVYRRLMRLQGGAGVFVGLQGYRKSSAGGW